MSETGWRTPLGLWEPLNEAVGGFKVDAAADQYNHLVDNWYGPGSGRPDALAVDVWDSPAWCNPPYGRDIDKWLQKFLEQGELGVRLVALIPASVETEWWYEHVASASEVGKADLIFLKGRVPFNKPCNHCGGSGKCADVLTDADGKPAGTCCDGPNLGCDVCDGRGEIAGGMPRFPSVLVIYGPTASGRVGWLDWRKRAEVAGDAGADVGDHSPDEGRR